MIKGFYESWLQAVSLQNLYNLSQNVSRTGWVTFFNKIYIKNMPQDIIKRLKINICCAVVLFPCAELVKAIQTEIQNQEWCFSIKGYSPPQIISLESEKTILELLQPKRFIKAENQNLLQQLQYIEGLELVNMPVNLIYKLQAYCLQSKAPYGGLATAIASMISVRLSMNGQTIKHQPKNQQLQGLRQLISLSNLHRLVNKKTTEQQQSFIAKLNLKQWPKIIRKELEINLIGLSYLQTNSDFLQKAIDELTAQKHRLQLQEGTIKRSFNFSVQDQDIFKNSSVQQINVLTDKIQDQIVEASKGTLQQKIAFLQQLKLAFMPFQLLLLYQWVLIYVETGHPSDLCEGIKAMIKAAILAYKELFSRIKSIVKPTYKDHGNILYREKRGRNLTLRLKRRTADILKVVRTGSLGKMISFKIICDFINIRNKLQCQIQFNSKYASSCRYKNIPEKQFAC